MSQALSVATIGRQRAETEDSYGEVVGLLIKPMRGSQPPRLTVTSHPSVVSSAIERPETLEWKATPVVLRGDRWRSGDYSKMTGRDRNVVVRVVEDCGKHRRQDP